MHFAASTTMTAVTPPRSPAIGIRLSHGSSDVKHVYRRSLQPPIPPGMNPSVMMLTMFSWRVPWSKTICFASSTGNARPTQGRAVLGERHGVPLDRPDIDNIPCVADGLFDIFSREVLLGTFDRRPKDLEQRFLRLFFCGHTRRDGTIGSVFVLGERDLVGRILPSAAMSIVLLSAANRMFFACSCAPTSRGACDVSRARSASTLSILFAWNSAFPPETKG